MKSIIYLLKLLLFWLIFFIFQRLLFITYNKSLFDSVPAIEIAQSWKFGFRLDWATSCYFLMIPFLFLLLSFFTNKTWIKKWNSYIAFMLLLLALLISMGNTLLYKEWQSLISKRAISFLLYPKEVIASLSLFYIVTAILAFVFVLAGFFLLWKKYLELPNQNTETNPLVKIGFTILTPFLLLMGARGGFQLIPINESSVYFSTHTAANHAAVNSVWYLGNSIWNPADEENKYHFMPDETAASLTSKLYACNEDSSLDILKSSKPNIIILVLESFTADVIGVLGGEKNICPNIDSLAKNGILFTQIYSSGSRTDQGLVSILSAFPAQPDKSIIKYTSKVAQLPSLFKDLNLAGYHSSFYYGGEVEFANMGAYLKQSGVAKIISKNDFNKDQINSKWGAHDEFVLNKQLVDLNSESEPFFSVLLTLSNHEPFETPERATIIGNDDANRFRNTAAYTDKCIGNYINEAKKQSWYKNTLFILVADHGHRLPENNDMNMPKGKHIPLLFFGEAIKPEFKAKRVTKIGNQHDIAATVMKQIKLNSLAYSWSKNLLNETIIGFAYYSNENVLGWITRTDTCVYSFIEKKNSNTFKTNPTEEKNAKAYLQQVYKDFLKR